MANGPPPSKPKRSKRLRVESNEQSGVDRTTKRPRKRASTQAGNNSRFLRELLCSKRLFWKDDSAEQLSQQVSDRNNRGVKRILPQNEVTVMALNEIAVYAGRGFFQHLPSRDVWKTPANEGLMPPGRVPHVPRFVSFSMVERTLLTTFWHSADYPTIVLMDFVWDEDSRTAFYAASHRARYLKGSFLLNPPTPPTPLYGIQYAPYESWALFETPVPSLVVFATSDLFYVASTSEIEATMGKSKRKTGPAPESRLEMPTYLYKSNGIDNGVGGSSRTLSVPPTTSLRELYDLLITRCVKSSTIAPSFTAARLTSKILPRPSNPAAVSSSIPLGTPQASVPSSHSRAGPCTSMGKRGTRSKMSNVQSDAEEVQMDVDLDVDGEEVDLDFEQEEESEESEELKDMVEEQE